MPDNETVELNVLQVAGASRVPWTGLFISVSFCLSMADTYFYMNAFELRFFNANV